MPSTKPRHARTHARRRAAARVPFALSLGAMLVSSACLPQAVLAGGGNLPTGGKFTAGGGVIGQSGNTVTVDQSSHRAIITWDGFSVGEAASARFNNGSGATLNRVTGNTASRIDGNLSASGSVYLVNPAGVVVGPKGTVNTGGTFAASTHDVDTQQFMDGGALTFKGASQAEVVNAGTIRSAQGDVALIARRVENRGTIEAPNGTVALAAGYEVLMRDAANTDGTVSVKIGGGDTEALNSGAIRAAQAELRANGGNVYALAGNTQGVIKATGTATKGGRIFLTAGDAGTVQSTGTLQAHQAGQGGTVTVTGGNVQVAGSIDASATTAGGQGGTVLAIAEDTGTFSGTIKAEGGQGGKGGFVDTSGKKRIKVEPSIRVSTRAEGGQTGTWLIDPPDFTVAASGGDFTGAQIASFLADNNVTLSSSLGGAGTLGNVNINDAITWTTGTTLSLTAVNSILINAAITGRNGGLSLTPSAAGTVTTGAGGAVDVGTFSLNQGTWNQIGGTLPAFAARDFRVATGANFVRLLGGNGAPGTPWLIGDVYGLQGLNGLAVAGGPNGAAAFALANDIDATGTRLWNDGAGFATIGGFAGVFDGGGHVIGGLTIDRAHQNTVGLFGLTEFATLRNVGLVNASIVGGSTTGGLVARLSGGSVQNAYVTGTVTGQDLTGGLVGWSDLGAIQNAYSGATVSGANEVGGLVGRMRAASLIDAYATGSVTGMAGVGGLVGVSGIGLGNPIQGMTASNVYASGRVTGAASVGGLLGYVAADTGLTNAYWDIDTTGQAASAGGGTGIGNASAYTQASYAGFDFSGKWFSIDGSTRPMLRSEYSTTLHTAHQVQLMAMDLMGAYRVGSDIDMGATRLSSDVWRADRGFVPIAGVQGAFFGGSLDGMGHTLDGLYIKGAGSTNVGLIGLGLSATIRRLALTNLSVDAGDGLYAGGLMGQQAGGLIDDVVLTGGVSGGLYTGGAVGIIGLNGVLSNTHAAVTVTNTAGATYAAGGLVGNLNTGSITTSSASGDVYSQGAAGGLAGFLSGSAVDSHASGSVQGLDAGGLVGLASGSITRSYATGSATGSRAAGGLVGVLASGATVLDAYAMGAVSSAIAAGGLVGVSSGSINSAFATGYVTGSGSTGGLVATASGSHVMTSSYWNTETSGLVTSAGGGTGLTTAQMQSVLLPGFNASVWGTGSGLYPYLQSQFAAGQTPKAVSGVVMSGSGVPSGAGAEVVLVSQGAQAGKAAIGANGYFYMLTSSSALDSRLLAYLHGDAQKGAVFNDQGVTRNLNLLTNALNIDTGAASVSATMAALAATLGSQASNADLDFIGPLGGTALSTTGGANLSVQAATSYLLDRDVSAGGTLQLGTSGNFGVSGSITLSGAQGLSLAGSAQWSGASSLSLVSASGGVTLAGAIDAADGTFAIDSDLGIALVGNTAINVDTYRQSGRGAWQQVGANLPGFYARDFQLDFASGTRFLRAQGGAGTDAAPYQLFDAYGLQGIAPGGVHYVLAGDIDASGTAAWNGGNGFAPIQAFDGTLDGANHAIDGLTIAANAFGESGMFGSLSFATIRDLALTNVSITGSSQTGALAGAMVGGTLDNVSVTGRIDGGSGTAGGLVGVAVQGAAISNARVDAEVSGGLYVGGLAGIAANATISGSQAAGTVTGNQIVGGLVGQLLRDDGVNDPGNASIIGSHASADVSGNLMVGGLAGFVQNGTVQDAYATGTVTVQSATAIGAGGLIGYLEGGTVRGAYATGSVSTNAGIDGSLGGLVGNAVGSAIEDSHASGAVTAQGNVFGYAGGLVGTLADSTIDRSFATGNVSGSLSASSGGVAAGGLVAVMQGASAIRNAYATGSAVNVSASATDVGVGGLVGVITAGTVNDAYSTGDVFNAAGGTGSYAGGLVGLLLQGSIGQSYAAGGVSGAAGNMGGLVGGIDANPVPPATAPSITASFWLDDGSGHDNGLGTALTLAQMRDLSTYTNAGWSIDDAGGTGATWRIYDGHTGPLLRTFLKSVTVTADDASKTYDGQAYQSAFTYGTSDNGAVLLGTLGSDLTNANAGSYAIAKGLYSGQSGYDITVQAGTLTIDKRQITVVADDQSRVYGDANPALTYTVGGAGLVGGESLTGVLTTSATAASGVGSYGITRGTLAASGNYDITGFTDGTLTIGKRALSVAADTASRDYGDANPAFTYAITGGSLVNGDQLGGALSTAATQSSAVGTYAIVLGTLGNANYDITGYQSATLSIVPRGITITANDASRDYGDANPAFTYTVGGRGLVNGDVLSGALSTLATAASGVGSYGIMQGTLAASGNYTVTGFTPGTLSIGRRAITLTANDASRDYGDANPAFTYTVGGRGLVNGDVLSGALSTLATAASGVGDYGITQGTLAASGNYTVTGFTPGTLSIGRRAITVTANDASRVYGDADPAFTYTVGGRGLVNGDVLGGLLATTAGERAGVGSYGIVQGSLAASSNYAVSYIGANLLVTPRPITVSANDQSKRAGQPDPLLDWSVSAGSLAAWDSLAAVFTGQLARAGGDLPGDYAIGQGSLAVRENYALGFVPGVFTILPGGLAQLPSRLNRSPFDPGSKPMVDGQEPGEQQDDSAGCGTGVAGGGVHPCNRALGAWLKVSSR